MTEFYGRKLSNERNWSISSEDIALIYDIRQPHNKEKRINYERG